MCPLSFSCFYFRCPGSVSMAEPVSWLAAQADPVTAKKTEPASFFPHFPTSGHNFSLSVSLKPLSEELGFASTCNTKRSSRFCVLYRGRMLRLECVLQLTLIRMCESWECSGWTSPGKGNIAFLREACMTLRFSPQRLLLLTIS